MLKLIAFKVQAVMRVHGCDIAPDQARLIAWSIIQEIRQPSDIMMDAGAAAGDWHPAVGRIDVDCAGDVWRAMIDAGLSEQL